MTDRGWGSSCGRTLRTDPRCAGKGYIHLMHNAYEVRDAQYALGQLADDGLIDPQKIGATGGSYGGGMSIALGALQEPHAAPRRLADPVDEPARQADADRRDRPRVHVVRPRDRADPERLARSTTSPTTRTSAAATASASRSRTGTARSTSPASCSATTRPVGHRPRRRHHRLEEPDRHRRPVRRQRRRRRPWSPSSPRTTRRYYIDDCDPARARRCSPTAGTTTCSRSTRRCATTTRSARSTRTRRSRCSTSTSATARAPARSRPPTAPRSSPPRTPGSTTTSRASAPSPPTRAAASTSSPPSARSARAGTRFHAPTWAQLAPGELRLDSTGAQTVTAPGTAPSNAFTSATSARRPRAPTTPPPPRTRRPGHDRPTRSRARRRSSPRSPPTGANDMVAARLYDVDGATERLIARGVQRPLGVGAGPTKQVFQLHPQAWTVAARPRAQARAALAGLDVPAHARPASSR